jgi:hypothetical protein
MRERGNNAGPHVTVAPYAAMCRQAATRIDCGTHIRAAEKQVWLRHIGTVPQGEASGWICRVHSLDRETACIRTVGSLGPTDTSAPLPWDGRGNAVKIKSLLLSGKSAVTRVKNNSLCRLVVRVPGYRPIGPGLDSRFYQIFW